MFKKLALFLTMLFVYLLVFWSIASCTSPPAWMGELGDEVMSDEAFLCSMYAVIAVLLSMPTLWCYARQAMRGIWRPAASQMMALFALTYCVGQNTVMNTANSCVSFGGIAPLCDEPSDRCLIAPVEMK